MSKSEKNPRKVPRPPRKSSKSSAKPVQDPVIAKIEEFMYECENMQPTPLQVNKGKIYDSDVDLLKILDSDNKKSVVVTPITNGAVMPPKKRKSNGKFEEPFKKTVKKDDTINKKLESVVKPRPKKFFIREGTLKEYVPPTLEQCKVLRSIKKKCSCSYHQVEELHKSMCASVKLYRDSQIFRNVVIKKEVVDLTSDEQMIFLRLNFAKITEMVVAEDSVGHLQILHSPARAIESNRSYHVAAVYAPEVYFAIDKACIDLTRVDRSEETNFAVTSEKECAYRILYCIYKYYKVQEASENVKGALREVEGYFSVKELERDYDFLATFFKNRFASLGSELIDLLSAMSVRNLNFDRFLESIVLKLDQNYNMVAKAPSVCLALYAMLNLNRENCPNPLAKELLKQAELYVTKVQMKEEFELVITEEQKMMLREQIEKYNELADRQEKLMAQLSFLDRVEPKSEIVSDHMPLLLGGIKEENPVIVID